MKLSRPKRLLSAILIMAAAALPLLLSAALPPAATQTDQTDSTAAGKDNNTDRQGEKHKAIPTAQPAGPAKLIKRLVRPDRIFGDQFGTSVSIDGNLVLIGADWVDMYDSTGAALLFERDNGGKDNWGMTKDIRAYDGQDCDQFGHSVALDSDTALIGANYYDNSRGAAYFFGRNAGGASAWGLLTQRFAFGGGEGDSWRIHFGSSVAVSGNFAVVGAEYANTDITDGDLRHTGAAYLFSRNLGGPDAWGRWVKIVAEDGFGGDHFGKSVDIDGDWAIVGAYYKSDKWFANGAAYIFHRHKGGANNWGQVTRLMNGTEQLNEHEGPLQYFGYSVGISGDCAVVGATADHEVYSCNGSAFVFQRNAGGPDNWGLVKKLVSPTPAVQDYMGSTIAIDGDYILVGVPGDNADGRYCGAGFLFKRDFGGPDNWGLLCKLVPPDLWFADVGHGAAIYGDYAVLGAPNEWWGGAAYLFNIALPYVSGSEVEGVSWDRAALGAEVLDEGRHAVSERGIVWGLEPDPTLESCLGKATAPGTVVSFSVEATGLAPVTQYHFRCYAVNSAGVAYGEDGAFTTAAPLGALKVNIGPSEAAFSGAAWRRLGALGWRAPGEVEHDLWRGNYDIEFKPIDGWYAPRVMRVEVEAGQETLVAADYSLVAGSLTVEIAPRWAALAGAAWRLRGSDRWIAAPPTDAPAGVVTAVYESGPIKSPLSPLYQGGDAYAQPSPFSRHGVQAKGGDAYPPAGAEHSPFSKGGRGDFSLSHRACPPWRKRDGVRAPDSSGDARPIALYANIQKSPLSPLYQGGDAHPLPFLKGVGGICTEPVLPGPRTAD